MNIANQIKHIPNGIETLREWLGEGGVPVDRETAQLRTDTCVACPMNSNGFSITAPVAKAIKRVVEIRNSAKLRTDGIKKLGTCSVCTCHLGTKIFVPIHIVKSQITQDESVQFEKANPNCWQITEQP